MAAVGGQNVTRRAILGSVLADSARLAGADALKYDEFYPASAGWPPSKQEAYQPNNNWDAFCRRQKQEYSQLESNLQEFEGIEEELRDAEIAWGELAAGVSQWQLEKGEAQTVFNAAERAATKAGSSCLCFGGGNSEKREATEEEKRIAREALVCAEQGEQGAQAKLEEPNMKRQMLQERRRSAAARALDQLEILDSLYTDTSDAVEQVAVEQVARLLQKGAQIEAALAAQKEALRLLHVALVHFEGGQARLGKKGGGTGTAEQLRLRQAGALLASSASAVQKALSAAPFAPGSARLKADPGGALAAFLNTDLPRVLHGAGAPGAAAKLTGVLDTTYPEVLALYQWHETSVSMIVEDRESNAASLAAGKRALLEERLRLVRQVGVQQQVSDTELRRRSSRISETGQEVSRLDEYANGQEPGRLDW